MWRPSAIRPVLVFRGEGTFLGQHSARLEGRKWRTRQPFIHESLVSFSISRSVPFPPFLFSIHDPCSYLSLSLSLSLFFLFNLAVSFPPPFSIHHLFSHLPSFRGFFLSICIFISFDLSFPSTIFFFPFISPYFELYFRLSYLPFPPSKSLISLASRSSLLHQRSFFRLPLFLFQTAFSPLLSSLSLSFLFRRDPLFSINDPSSYFKLSFSNCIPVLTYLLFFSREVSPRDPPSCPRSFSPSSRTPYISDAPFLHSFPRR